MKSFLTYKLFSALMILLLSFGLVGCPNATQLRRSGQVTTHTFRVEYNNVHLVRTPRGVLMIDTGLERDKARVVASMRSVGIEPKQIRLLILTHGHADHAGSAAYFKKTYGIKVIAGRGDVSMLKNGRNTHLCPTDSQAKGMKKKVAEERYTSVVPDILVDGTLDLRKEYGINAIVRQVPGHTPGSLVVEFPNEKIMFVGDIFRGQIVSNAEPWVHFFHCNLKQNRDNIQALLARSKAQIFYTGHFGSISRDRLPVLLNELSKRLQKPQP